MLCRHFLLKEKVDQVCSLYGYIYKEYEREKENPNVNKSLRNIYEEDKSEESRKEIIDLINKVNSFEEMKGLKGIIEVIQNNKYIMLDHADEKMTIEPLERLKSIIRHLLFDGHEPIISISNELLIKTPEVITRERELKEIREKWTGRLLKLDIKRAMRTNDIESVWELLEEFTKRDLMRYIPNKEEMQDILAELGNIICSSRDIMNSLLNN